MHPEIPAPAPLHARVVCTVAAAPHIGNTCVGRAVCIILPDHRSFLLRELSSPPHRETLAGKECLTAEFDDVPLLDVPPNIVSLKCVESSAPSSNSRCNSDIHRIESVLHNPFQRSSRANSSTADLILLQLNRLTTELRTFTIPSKNQAD